MVITQALVEQTDLLPHLASDEHHTDADREDVQDPIELALVDLSGLEGGVRVAETIGGPTHVTELTGVLPVHDLRTHDADPLDTCQLRRFDQALDRLRVQRHVVP